MKSGWHRNEVLKDEETKGRQTCVFHMSFVDLVSLFWPLSIV